MARRKMKASLQSGKTPEYPEIPIFFNPMKSYTQYMGLAFQWGILLGLAVWGGLKLDEKLHFSALFIIIFPLLALAYLFYSLLKSFSNKK